MIIAVISAGVVQVTAYQVICMLAVRHRFMTAALAVGVIRVMRVAAMARRASIWVLAIYLEPAFIDMIPMHGMEMSIMQVVHMILMPHGLVSAGRPMLVRVIWMRRVFRFHDRDSFLF